MAHTRTQHAATRGELLPLVFILFMLALDLHRRWKIRLLIPISCGDRIAI
jgi:hypothetical protein